jgi:hypothetical protein
MTQTASGHIAHRLPADAHGVARSALAAAGLVGVAIVHLLDAPGKFEETPYLGFLFLGLIAASLLVAEMILRDGGSIGWLAGAGLAAATILGYVVSRTIGLPGAPEDDLGNWSEPLGMASLMVEAVVAWLCVTGWQAARRPAS